MIIDPETCIGCGACVYTCTVNAISPTDDKAEIDREACVECGNCLRVAGCPTGALQQDELAWPRSVRKYFSDNQCKWPEEMRYTLGYGRGTEECKTNDRTGKFRRGEVGVMVELGRPNTGTSLRNAELIIQALIRAGAEMAENSPMTALIGDRQKGLLKEGLGTERVLSCIVESKVKLGDLEKTLTLIREIAPQLDTVFSLGLVTRMEGDGFTSPIEPVLKKMGLEVRPNAKMNLGLGRPLSEA
ncbi:MAG: 4Fe-4S binding protein [Deltaproteobacteria bacterium]|nr:4Fe-4S binding protein [Deltaproteobacteria bacterium]